MKKYKDLVECILKLKNYTGDYTYKVDSSSKYTHIYIKLKSDSILNVIIEEDKIDSNIEKIFKEGKDGNNK